MSEASGIDVEHLSDGTIRVVVRTPKGTARMRVTAEYARGLAARLVPGNQAPQVTYENGVPSDLMDKLAEKIRDMKRGKR